MVDSTAGPEVAAGGERVVVLAPFGRDAVVLCEVLAQTGLTPVAVDAAGALGGPLWDGAGTLLLTEEALAPGLVTAILARLSAEPPWSDMPMVLLAGRGALMGRSAPAISALRSAGNLTVLERPAQSLTLVTALQAALRARRRQYEIRDLLLREQAARQEAEAASRIKEEFLATVSHELRTPLGSLLLWTRLLNSGRLAQEKTQQALRAIESSAETQSQLIEDLLDLSRMTQGKLGLSVEETNLSAVVWAAVDTVRPAAEAKRIRIEAAVEPDAGLVLADPPRIQQVVVNLLSNAVKFTASGGRASIHLERAGDHVRIRVTDTGRGISPQFLPHVFERFRQADATVQRLQSGLGIGLTISRRLVELHGGTICAESPGEGRGAIFTVELPLAATQSIGAAEAAPSAGAPEQTAAAAGSSLNGIRVLLVEDDPSTREVMALTLRQQGAEVTAVGSGGTALEHLSATGTPATGGPHVLVSDLGMPGMDGYELLRRVRAMEEQRGQPALPAVLISAYARPEDRERALLVGFAAHIPKPFEPQQLISAVDRLGRCLAFGRCKPSC
jgi:signal transduction histidine kinase/CheY-like chemotaxis protein